MSNNKSIWLADSHVHYHDCFNWNSFFDNSFENITRISSGEIGNGILFFTEGKGADYFNYLKSQEVLDKLKAQYSVTISRDGLGIIIQHKTTQRIIIIIKGFQIVTSENLEVLALGTLIRHPEGSFIEETISAIVDSGGVPVVPWGFGKWYGSRGDIIDRIIMHNSGSFFLGDNGGRSGILPYPGQFKRASDRGIKILPGSDPLPFPEEIRRPLSYGFRLNAEIEPDEPWRSIKTRLTDPEFQVESLGKLTGPFNFIKTQISMQIKKRNSK